MSDHSALKRKLEAGSQLLESSVKRFKNETGSSLNWKLEKISSQYFFLVETEPGHRIAMVAQV